MKSSSRSRKSGKAGRAKRSPAGSKQSAVRRPKPFMPAAVFQEPLELEPIASDEEFNPSWKLIFLAAVAFGVIAFFLHMVDSIFTMSFYTDPANLALWSKVMMPGAGAPPASFFALSLLTNMLLGFALAYAYLLVRSTVKQESPIKTGLFYGSMIFMFSLPYYLGMYLTIAIPPLLLADWAVWGFVISLIGATAIAKIVG